MKKNGFIATSLIYAFFLMFITLFLGVIADYIQNKVLLEEIENGIKKEINDTIGIKDFEVGDMVGFISDCTKIVDEIDSAPLYAIASVVINNSTKCNGGSNCLILYGVKLDNYSNNLTFSNIQEDIDYAYQNNTYYNKIIYNFDSSFNTSYNLGDYNVYKNGVCESTDYYVVGDNCIKNESGTDLYRERYILKDIGNRFTICQASEGTDTIYIQYTK